jgi:exonuclease III
MVELVENIKVASLNVWGLMYVSKNRKERIRAIGQCLKISQPDVILLQELWLLRDFLTIKTHLGPEYRGFRFEGGLVGCGLAIFTKLAVVEGSLRFKKFEVSGRMWRFWEGDWFTGKGLMSIQLITPNSKKIVKVINTHLQSSYNTSSKLGKDYEAEKSLQIFDLVDEIHRQVSNYYILGGDFNVETGELPWKILMQSVNLEESNPTDLPTGNNIINSFKRQESRPMAIDHLFFSNTLNVDSFTILEEKIADKKISLSDHALLQAIYTLNSSELKESTGLKPETIDSLNTCLNNEITQLCQMKIRWLLASTFFLLFSIAFAVAASVIAISDASSAAALTSIMGVVSPLTAAIALLTLQFALDAKSTKSALKNKLVEITLENG